MISKIKNRLGFGKPIGKLQESSIEGSQVKLESSKSSFTDTVDAIPRSVGDTGRKVEVPLRNVECPVNAATSSHRSAAPILLPVDHGSVDSDDGVIMRGRVGRVSNRLSKRAEMMRNQSGGDKAMLSKSLRTLESIASTGSQAEFFHPQQSMLIFDWDDTLCPSHWIRINRPKLQYFQPCPDDPRFKLPLESLSDQVIKVLRASVLIAKTIILTNAQVSWVEISCKNFMPRVWPVIQELKIDIVYARQSVEQDVASCKELDYNYNANAPQLWKERAMKDNISRFYSQYLHQSWKNIVSIGDQVCEHNACRIVALARPSGKRKCRTKTVKLIEEPSIENLVAENQVILQWLGGLVQYDGDLSVDLSNDDDVLLDLHDLLARK